MDKLEKIKLAYMEYFLENGTQPSSVFAFAKKNEIKEGDFYEYYNSFDHLESDIWLGFFHETKSKIEAEEVYYTYSVREKFLAFYYTWIEVLKQHRSYTIQTWSLTNKHKLKTPVFMTDLKIAFKDFSRNLIADGKESNEVQSRKLIDERCFDALWVQLLMILDVWVKDRTKGFEQTEAKIEKSVNTLFVLLETNQTPPKKDFRAWLKRLGWAGFFFFLIKGLLWLIVPYLIAKGIF